jgi:hypothetical protein
VNTTQATLTPRAARLAGVITAALLLLGIDREVTAGADTVTIGDIVLQWTESWTTLRAGIGERRTGQAGWEVRLLPSALPSGIIHNNKSAVQQVVVLVALDAVKELLETMDASPSDTLASIRD